jgi:hypothetical protein
VTACLSLCGLVTLSFVFGAAAMYYQFPPCENLSKAFKGFEAWREREVAAHTPRPPSMVPEGTVTDFVSDKACDGLTLYTTNTGSWAALMDMHGNVLHQWQMPFSKAFPHPEHISNPFTDDRIHWFRAHLFPNGDLLAIYHADGDTPYGYGLVKLDKDSKLLWTYAANVHHDLDIDEDGRIYLLTQTLVSEPPVGLEDLKSPYIADFLVVLSPDGRPLGTPIPLLEAFRDSPYAAYLKSASKPEPVHLPKNLPLPPGQPPPAVDLQDKGDILHANSVKVLPRSLAATFPQFKPGQVLISLRNVDTLAMVDPKTRSVVWAAHGIWDRQHDAMFLDNGNLLVFDNLGGKHGARVLEYDPVTQAVPWAVNDDANGSSFTATFRGVAQRLPNGNTLFVNPDDCLLVEVTKQKEIAWRWHYTHPPLQNAGMVISLTGAHRFGPDELTFLKGETRGRP